MFNGYTLQEITIELLLVGLLTVSECIDKRIEWRAKFLKTIIYN